MKWAMPIIERVDLLAVDAAPLRAEARREGFDFIETLLTDWYAGANRFDGPGEILCGCIEGGELVAVGGLNRDPFLDNPRIGRIRRVYVRELWRSRGVGTALVTCLVQSARPHFACVRLRAANPRAAQLYEHLGFTPVGDPNATHILCFERESQGPGAGTPDAPAA
jgi:GNAT superfamily N-acetyltransferase